jgi:uncharacterized protein
MAQSAGMDDTPIALVMQHRVADASYAAYTRWLARLKERLRSQPGFIADEVVAPAPPAQLDWIMVARFANAQAAGRWLESPERAAALAEIRRPHLLADEEVHLMEDRGPRRQSGASAFFAYDVSPEKEEAFQEWQKAIHAEEIRQPGFLRRKIEPPVPGAGDEWIIVLTFDNDANLSRWLNSPDRQNLLQKGRALELAARVSRTSYGFDFWFRGNDTSRPGNGTILKNNLLVLLVLNPIVYLWGLGPAPVLAAHGVPPWLGLFIGDLVSTQLLGWWFAPAVSRAFGWWLAPDTGWRSNVVGYAFLVALYAVSMAIHAALLGYAA